MQIIYRYLANGLCLVIYIVDGTQPPPLLGQNKVKLSMQNENCFTRFEKALFLRFSVLKGPRVISNLV